MRKIITLASVALLLAAALWGWRRASPSADVVGQTSVSGEIAKPTPATPACNAARSAAGREGGPTNVVGRPSAGGADSGNHESHAAIALKPEIFSLSRFTDVVLDRDPDFGTPHFVRRRSGFLSPPAPGAEPDAILEAFIRANDCTMTLNPADLREPNADVRRDFVTRHNGMRRVVWQQKHDGLDIYGAHLILNLTKDNQIINVSSRALNIESVRFHPDEKIDQQEALNIARDSMGGGEVRTTYAFRKVWYPLDMISCVKGWEAALECAGTNEAKAMIIRADTGQIAQEFPITWSEAEKNQPQIDANGHKSESDIRVHSRSFAVNKSSSENISLNVYTGDSPIPLTPGPDTPTNPVLTEVGRVLMDLVALDTNASPEGWIPAGSNELLGNNADVYTDWNDDSLPDQPRLTGFPYRVFDCAVDLTKQPTNYVEFSQAQAFYWVNFFHDRLYVLGFDEPSGNFQDNNFGRGGLGGDRLKIETQNGASLGFDYYNKAYYMGFGDGTEGKVTISIWSRTTPRRDGVLDGQLVLHEAAHGLTTRLVGNGYGLTKTQPRGMGEGWSDFFALSLLSEASDRTNGCYPIGDYAAVYDDWPGLTYFGVRRFPYSTDLTKSPQTFADTDPNQIYFPTNVPRNPRFGSAEADQIHNLGEIWCLALWECRANLLSEYGFAGNDLMNQLVVDGLKLTPTDPRFDQTRDAILQADLVNNGGTNSLALWRGFAKRGLGYSAFIPEPFTTVGIREAYDLPLAVTVTVAEVTGDHDGYVEPGETANMIISLTSLELDLSGMTGRLATSSTNLSISASNTVFANISAGMSATSATPFVFAVSSNFPGFTDAAFTLRVTSDKGWFEQSIVVRIGNPYDHPPEILGVIVTNITETNAWVQWHTGIASTGRIFYGTTTIYGATAPSAQPMGTNHAALLTNLVKGTTYHFQIAAYGTNGLMGLSTDMTFRTRARIYVYAGSTATQELGTLGAPFKTLQAAAEAAKLTGDEILVAEGVYTGGNPEAVLNLDGVAYDQTITGGYAPDFSECNPQLHETILDGQYQRRGIRLDNGAKLTLSSVTITHGSGEWGGGAHVRKSSAYISSCFITGNCSTSGINHLGGGFYATLGSRISVSDSSVINNKAGNRGGAIYSVSDGTIFAIRNCTIYNNTSSIAGGGLRIELASGLEMYDSTIGGNKTGFAGGGISIAPFSTGVIEYATISYNCANEAVDPDTDGGGGVSIAGSSSRAFLFMSGSIVFSNKSTFGNNLRCAAQSEVHASYCNIGDIYGHLTTSNHLINANPMFANPANEDFHLLYSSPCIDTGSPDYSDGDIDMDDEPRPFGLRVDMGADEFTDVDADHMADYWEILHFGSITVSDGTGDPDGDELLDFEEYMRQIDPLNSDTDGDGMTDGWEAHRGLDPQINDAGDDPDADGMKNIQEYIADTDPFDGTSFLGLLNISDYWGGKRLDWKGGVNAWQLLDYTTAFNSTGAWVTLAAFPPPRPITNAVVVFGLDQTNVILRIQAHR